VHGFSQTTVNFNDPDVVLSLTVNWKQLTTRHFYVTVSQKYDCVIVLSVCRPGRLHTHAFFSKTKPHLLLMTNWKSYRLFKEPVLGNDLMTWNGVYVV